MRSGAWRIGWVTAVVVAGACSGCKMSDAGGEKPVPWGGGGAGGQGGSGAGPSSSTGPAPVCEPKCAGDLTAVLDCNGAVLEPCASGEKCNGAKCLDACGFAAATRSSSGCDFWAIKTALRPQADGACFAAYVVNASTKNAHLMVSYDGKTPKPEGFIYIPKIDAKGSINYEPYNSATGLGVGQAAVLFLAVTPDFSDVFCAMPVGFSVNAGVDGTGKGKGFHITTEYPIVAYQMLPHGGGWSGVPSATLLLPTSTWGTNYMAINAYSAVPDPAPPKNPYGGYPSLDIVAREDATTVTLLPKAPILGGGGVPASGANKPAVYTLNAGEFLQITQPEELTGSIIESDKPVGVFGASTAIKLPASVNDNDSAHQQLPPLHAFGSEYVAVRHKDRIAGQEESTPWRIVGAVKDTVLTWEDSKPNGAPDVIGQGEVVEFDAPGPFVVRSQGADHPFYLGGYMTGGQPYDNIGDPEWVNIVPPQQYLEKYAFFTDPSYPETSLVVVRAPSSQGGTFADVTLKCRGVLGGWQKVGKFEYTRVDLVTGNFTDVDGCTNGAQEMSSAQPFGVTVWGWGTVPQSKLVSYAYPAGAGVLPINSVKIGPTPN